MQTDPDRPEERMQHTVKTNCPRDCYDGCGLIVVVEEGKKPRVLGDPDHPIARGKPCGKCGVAYNGSWQDPTARLLTPLRRTGPKGAGQFEPIGWEEALREIAGKFNGIVEEHGGDSILGVGYTGNLSLHSFFFPYRFLTKIGASIVEWGKICNETGAQAWELLYGSAFTGFDPRTARDSSCILLWGTNPSHTAPHMHEHWLSESPAKVVVVDPVRTLTAEKADLHLQPRPGTDAALAFALLHALREQGGFDEAFIAEHVVGAEEIAADIDRCTPVRGEELTGVPAADIRLAAEFYGTGPALLWVGQALQRQPQGGNVMRAAGLLPALTGNIGKPGAGFFYVNELSGYAGVDQDYLMGTGLADHETKRVGALDLAERLMDTEEFKAFIVWNTNPLASGADIRRLREACSREDLFTVVVDLFETDTARYADIVLPAASFLEYNDITMSYFSPLVGAQSKAFEPLGESLPTSEIFRRIAAAMSLNDAPLHEADEEIIAELMKQMNFDFDFAELQKRGHVYLGGDEPIIFHEDLSFDTSSGKVEIASDKAEEEGIPRVPHSGVDDVPPPDRLRLLTPASRWRMNDSYANDRKLVRRAGEAEFILCARDAARFGVVDGTDVRVSSEVGSIVLKACIRDIVKPGTALSYKGRWPSREPEGNNLNILHKGRKSDMAEGSSVHGMLVQVEPV